MFHKVSFKWRASAALIRCFGLRRRKDHSKSADVFESSGSAFIFMTGLSGLRDVENEEADVRPKQMAAKLRFRHSL